jgi:acyl transferase domain-containing protein
MNKQLLTIVLLAGMLAVAGCNKEEIAPQEEATPMAEEKAESMAEEKVESMAEEKPHVMEEAAVTMEAMVTAVNQETREVTVETGEGESVSFIAGEEVRNLAQVEVGDKIMVEYIEAVEIQVVAADQAEVGAEGAMAAARAEKGEKPAGVAMTENTVILVIEAINKENETVTVKGPAGNSKTVKVRDPANLDKVVIGDKVIVTYSEALGIKVSKE